jgi:DeoR/GlpR family transcriptional regulator of sugar metabolism
MSTLQSPERELAAGRLDRLRKILHERRIARVDELAAALAVSPATVRRDLAELDQRGEVRRVHGGAVATESRLTEPLFDDKTAVASAEKKRIAEAALRLIRANDSIYLDGGSTVLALAALLRERTDISVTTNSLRVAVELAGGGPPLIVVGGELRRLSQTFVGPLTRFTLDPLHVDKAFIGTIGLTPDAGLTTTDPREAYTKSLIMEHAREVILLADSRKIGQVSFTRFGALDRVALLITDRGIRRAQIAALTKRNIKVLAV